MNENKKTKVVLTGQIRIPAEIEREIDIEAAKSDRYKYAVIIDAWRCYQKMQEMQAKNASPLENSASSTEVCVNIRKDIDKLTEPEVLMDGVHIGPQSPASSLEKACAERLLNCLRSTKPKLPEAAVALLTQLDDLRELYERQRDADAAHAPAASEAQRSGEFERQSASLKRNQDLIDEKLRGIRALGEGTSARKDVHAGKPRKRR